MKNMVDMARALQEGKQPEVLKSIPASGLLMGDDKSKNFIEADAAVEHWDSPDATDPGEYKALEWEKGPVNRYQLMQPGGISRVGGSVGGEVFDIELGMELYVKMSDPKYCQENKNIPLDNLSYLVYNEALILAEINHPNIIKVYDFTIAKIGDKYVPCMLMEKLNGKCMRDMILARDGWNHEVVIDMLGFMVEIAEAVDYLHEHGILHNDLKIGNYFVDNKQVAKGSPVYKRAVLFDFGVARRVGKDLSIAHIYDTSIFTPGMASPWVVLGGTPEECDDRWAFAASIFELLTRGKIPFGEDPKGEPHPTSDRVIDPANLLRLSDMEEMVKMYGKDECTQLDELFETVLNDQSRGKNPEVNSCKKIIDRVHEILKIKVNERGVFPEE